MAKETGWIIWENTYYENIDLISCDQFNLKDKENK